MPRNTHKTKPTHLKLVEGTYRPDRAPKKEIAPPPALSDTPPRGLDVHARRVWRQYAPLLRRLGLLTQADTQSFLSLCEAWSRYERANVRLRAVFRQQSALTPERLSFIRQAEVSVERAEHTLRQLWSEFGMTPAARSRLDVYAPPPENEEDDFARKYLSGPSA